MKNTREAKAAGVWLLGALVASSALHADDDSITKDLHISQVPMVIAAPERASDTPGSKSTALTVKARVDRNDATYRAGDNVRLAVEASDDAYLWVFDTGTSGKVHRIFPNRFDQDNFVRKGAEVTIPGAEAKYDFRVSSPSGRELITVIATTNDSPLADELVEEAVGASPFFALAGTAASVAKDLSVSLRNDHPVWARDVVVFEIE